MLFTLNNETHMYNTRNNNLHLPLVHLTKFSKGPYITGIKVFNHLQQNLKTLVHYSRKFKYSLKSSCISILFIPWKNIMNTKKSQF